MITPGPELPTGLEWCITNALWWIATGDPPAAAVFTQDVVATSPILEVSGRDNLLDKLGDQRGGLTNVEGTLDRVEGDVTAVVVSWHVAADHTGAMLVNEDLFYKPSGRRVHLNIVSSFELRDGRIAAFHNEFDVDEFSRQLGRP